MKMRHIKKGHLLKASASTVDKYGNKIPTFCIWVVLKDFEYDTLSAQKVHVYPPKQAGTWGNRVHISAERFKDLEFLGDIDDFPEYNL